MVDGLKIDRHGRVTVFTLPTSSSTGSLQVWAQLTSWKSDSAGRLQRRCSIPAEA